MKLFLPSPSLSSLKDSKSSPKQGQNTLFQNKETKTRTQQKTFFQHHFRSPKRNLLRTFNILKQESLKKKELKLIVSGGLFD